MDKKYTYEDFLEIIKTLRSENGCPWDREQTHASLKPCMMEEAAEVLAAIRIYDTTGNYENLREELGDVLLQVVMHAEIAGEEGLFTMEDVVDKIAEKMVRRHPHVFGNVVANTSDQVLQNWDDIKKKEKGEIHSPLKEIPLELPALTRAPKVLKAVDKFYEPAENYDFVINSLEQAVQCLKECSPDTDQRQMEKLVGDVLMDISRVSRMCKLSQEQILTDRIDNIISHYEGGES